MRVSIAGVRHTVNVALLEHGHRSIRRQANHPHAGRRPASGDLLMHEMSIAGAVLHSVTRHAGGRRVTRVQLRIGHLRQVVPGALDFAWQLITPGTLADKSILGISQVEAAVECSHCCAESVQSGMPMRCGWCGGLDVQIVRGEELEIDWLEIEADADSSNGSGAVEAN
jgi:hydrogenase nickel incorporation protein HypA/HybF